nr:hypothetical protein BaRGS_031649 [Batillaria attramentaria]
MISCFLDRNRRKEVDECLKRIQAHKGVVGTIVINNDGIPIRTTLDNSTTVQYAGLLCSLTQKARSVVRDLDPGNDLTFFRIRSKKIEIMCAPGNEEADRLAKSGSRKEQPQQAVSYTEAKTLTHQHVEI